MKVTHTEIEGVLILEPTIYKDDRGWFKERYRTSTLEAHGVPQFVQENHSRSYKGVLRGLHYQHGENAQGKLVSCIVGKLWDVAVDIRKGSETFGKSVSIELTAENHKMIYVPPGCAHGFLALEDCEMLYQCTAVYKPATESGIIWNDEKINIKWPTLDVPYNINEKDRSWPTLATGIL